MDTEKNVEGQMNLFEDETTKEEVATEKKDELKEAIEETLSKIRRQSMLIGFQVSCQTILDKIVAFEKRPGSKSNNDHKRLIKDIKQFCEISLSRKVNTDGETEPIEETTQN